MRDAVAGCVQVHLGQGRIESNVVDTVAHLCAALLDGCFVCETFFLRFV